MSLADRIIVLKFGGSVLDGPAGCRAAVHEIYRYVCEGYRVVAVTSAFRGETDALFSLARAVSSEPHSDATAALVRTGELRSAAALVIACDAAGLRAALVEPHQVKLKATGDSLDADPVSVDADAIREALRSVSVAVVPGYHGYGDDGKPRLLGRGGTDLTALFLANALDAECTLVKDVDAWYDNGTPLRSLHLDDAAKRRDTVVQEKAASYAAINRVPFAVARLGDGTGAGTAVGLEATAYAGKRHRSRRQKHLRVAFAGVGVVGSGAWYHLSEASADFKVVGGLVRDVDRPRDNWIPRELLVSSPGELPPHDLLVEAFTTAVDAYPVVKAALLQGVSVVTANKALIATHGEELLRIADSSSALLRYSAAVGGSCPVIEFASSLVAETEIVSVRAILNATSNFVLGEIANGQPLEVAVRTAQEQGYAEADPSSDLSGLDAAYKLVILIHSLTGQWIDVNAISREDLRDLSNTATTGNVKQVATVVLPADASVRLDVVEDDDPLSSIAGNWNAVVVETADGRRSIVGRGAGRWPTAESVVADCFNIRRSISQSVALAEAC